MTRKIRWGILSTAGINVALIPAIRNTIHSELVAVASRNAERANSYALENSIPKSYGSYADLIADPDIDVIYNPLPNTLHNEWTVKAAQAGKHVLCEKPLVTTMEEFNAIERSAEENDVIIFEAFMSLHAPQNRKVKNMISEGKLGDLQLIDSWFTYYLSPEEINNIRLNPELGGGAFWDIGVYPNSLAITMAQAGPPKQVWGKQILGETGVDVSFIGQLIFANGTVAQISCGLRAPFAYGARFIGSEGIIEIDDPIIPGMKDRVEAGPDSVIHFSTIDGSSEEIVVPNSNPWQAEVEAMEECLLNGAEPVVPLKLSRDFLKSALALMDSASTGEVVYLS